MLGMTSRRNLVDGKPTSLLDLGYITVGLDDKFVLQHFYVAPALIT